MYKIAKGKQKDKAKQQEVHTASPASGFTPEKHTTPNNPREGGWEKQRTHPHTQEKAKVQRSRRTTPRKALRDFTSLHQRNEPLTKPIDETKQQKKFIHTIGTSKVHIQSACTFHLSLKCKCTRALPLHVCVAKRHSLRQRSASRPQH